MTIAYFTVPTDIRVYVAAVYLFRPTTFTTFYAPTRVTAIGKLLLHRVSIIFFFLLFNSNAGATRLH